MNDMTTTTAPDHRFNRRAYFSLKREMRGQLDREAARKRMQAAVDAAGWQGGVARPSEERLDQEAESYGCTAWSDFDLLAFRRAQAAIVHADAFGFGVSAEEADALDSRDPARVAATAREITKNLRKLAGANEADGRLLVASALACEADD